MPLTYIVSLWWRCLKPFWLCWMYALSSPVMSAVTHWDPSFPCNSNLVPLNQAFPPSTPSCSHFLIIIICSQLPLFFLNGVCAHAHIQIRWYSRGGAYSFHGTHVEVKVQPTRVLSFLHVGTELGSSSLATSTFIHWFISIPTLIMSFLGILNFLLSLHNCPL